MKILILGGYGNAGRATAELLLQETEAYVILAGRSEGKARVVADNLNAGATTPRVRGMSLDVTDPHAVAESFANIDMVVLAASGHNLTAVAADAAVQAGIDYFDMQLSSEAKWDVLNRSASAINERGCLFVTDGGFHPGIPAALVRYAAAGIEALEKADVYALVRMPWSGLSFSNSTIVDFAEEIIRFKPEVYRDGRWIALPGRSFPRFDFGDPYGTVYCAPMRMTEMTTLTATIPSLRDTGLYMGGLNPVMDYVAMPLALGSFRLFGERALPAIGRMTDWVLSTFSKPPYGTVLILAASGRHGGRSVSKTIRVSHHDAYFLTAVPVVACIRQYIDNKLPDRGLFMQAHVVDPVLFFEDAARMGITIEVS